MVRLAERDLTVIDAFEVGYAQAQLPRGRNVPGPAIEKVLLSIVVELVTVAGDAVAIVLTHGRCAFFTPLLFDGFKFDRSEEHTSELQSHSDLVCRLLLD